MRASPDAISQSMSPEEELHQKLPPWEKTRFTNAWWRLYSYEQQLNSKRSSKPHTQPSKAARRWSLPALFRCDSDLQPALLHGSTTTAESTKRKTWEKNYSFFLNRYAAERGRNGKLPPSWSRAGTQQPEPVNWGNRARSGSASLWQQRQISDSSCNSDMLFSMDSSDLDSAGTSTSGGSSSSEMYPPMDPERLLRLAFTEYHNNATFSCNRYVCSVTT
jgi:hypothetical protein